MLQHARTAPQAPARILLLGAGGFLGRSLLPKLKEFGSEVTALGSRDCDLTSPAAAGQLRAHLREGDTIVFLSALTPDKGRDSATLMKNLEMARSVAAAAKAAKAGHLVYASSDAVYSFETSLISEKTPAAPTDLYGAMHRAREIVLAAESGAPLAILRFTAVYGLGDTHNSYGPNRFVRQANADRKIPLGGEGEETRDHLCIADAVEVTSRVVAHGSTGLLNVASGASRSFREIAEAIAVAKSGTAIAPSPRQSPATHRHFDTTALLEAFPDMRFTPFDRGLTAMLG